MIVRSLAHQKMEEEERVSYELVSCNPSVVTVNITKMNGL